MTDNLSTGAEFSSKNTDLFLSMNDMEAPAPESNLTSMSVLDTGTNSGYTKIKLPALVADNILSITDRTNYLQQIAKNFTPSREFTVADGMALSIWEDKYSRRKEDGSWQTWRERLTEVVVGNFLLENPNNTINYQDFVDTLDLAIKGVMPFSGRHLQHGDIDQPNKNMELFSNCSTGLFNFIIFWLLLNGSGVGSDYSCYTRRINYCRYMPNIRLVLSGGAGDWGDVATGAHPDYRPNMNEFSGTFESLNSAKHKYPAESEDTRWFTVEDSREGWVKVLEIIETATWQEKHADKLFIFEFSQVREAGKPIKGQQNRPASGPLPLMRALAKVASLKGMSNMAPWKQAMFVDHYMASCVALGGIRRSARMATKIWSDPDIFEFIEIKRGGNLWSANISVLANEQFWEQVNDPRTHAWRVFQAITAAQYYDETGEPGILNMHNMNCNKSGMENITSDNYINPNSKLKIHEKTKDMLGKILGYVLKMACPFIVNPCAEIVMALYGAYCIIGDVCLANALTLEEAIRSVELMGPFLVRVNLMNSLYAAEVSRTNRIGISITGIHEFAARHFNIGFRDMVNVLNPVNTEYFDEMSDETKISVTKFWEFIELLQFKSEAAVEKYCLANNLEVPHTSLTIKPSGTISKAMGCTEGAHLPAVKYYMRWVQFPKFVNNDQENPTVIDFKERGYPVKDISHQYANAVVVGFPTKQPIVELLGDKVVTAEEATPAEQFEYMRLLESKWFGYTADGKPKNNQISYTLKYNPKKIDYDDYMKILRNQFSTVRCCSIMPITDTSAYAYQPEEKITKKAYHQAMRGIKDFASHEAYDDNELSCAGGVCAVDLSINKTETVSV